MATRSFCGIVFILVAHSHMIASAVQTMATRDFELSGGTDQTHIAPNRQLYRQPLDNFMDVLYTGLVNIKEKQLKVIFDTGSFEPYVFSTNCSVCGSESLLYDMAGQRTWRRGISTFGSGTLFSEEVTDSVSIGPIVSSNLSFWSVSDAEFSIIQKDNFQGIFGLGPPSSALKMARMEADNTRQVIAQFIGDGHNLTDSVREMKARYEGSLMHAQTSVPFVHSIGLTSVSVCYFPHSGSGGFQIWHDDSVEQQRSKFETIPLVGDKYWSSTMTAVRLRRGNSFLAYSLDPHAIACMNQSCLAVLDTGSTLISAPSPVVHEIYRLVTQWASEGGNCSDVRDLPHLEFTLGGVSLSLPPESYMGMGHGELDSQAPPSMLFSTQERGSVSVCQPLILSLDEHTEHGPMWIFGQTFFRKYYTNFHFSESLDAMTMSFSVASIDCEPGWSPTNANLLVDMEAAQTKPSQLNIDMSKISLPKIGHSKR
eukprot:TRINITY_DN9473_c0_g2_i1.p1 TRINITY_DN9473_c0_g2~~TRINITY_DN9473_c0_g2_i1.p1  ORF type:complete len:482 (+),score=42.30 TRINITY_DN9473_c0_g2_i1:55-1500(+)